MWGGGAAALLHKNQAANGQTIVTNIEIVDMNRPRYGEIKRINTYKHTDMANKSGILC